jgi:membrane protease YdiL (CAAX protease family)
MSSEKPWTLTETLWLISSIFVCVVFVSMWQVVIQHFTGKDAFEEGTLLFLVFSSLALHGSILCGTGFFLWINELSWSKTFGFDKPHKLHAMLLGIVAALVFLPVGMVLQDISIKVLTMSHFETPPQAAVEEFSKTVSFGSRAYLTIFAVILAPIAEEIFFRGILYRGLKQIKYRCFTFHSRRQRAIRRALRRFAPAVVSSLAFAAIHKSPAIFVPLFVLSLVLAWLYEKTGNLLASITAHSLFNAINVVLLFVGDRVEEIFDRHFHHFQ